MNDNNAPHYTELPIAQLEENKGQIDGLPANPRNIQPDKLAKLKRSILDNPEMLQLRGILVYPHGDKYIVIGGNMRLRAMVELGMASAPCVVIPSHVTADKLRAYTILDNSSMGEWDWQALQLEWDTAQLDDWGIDLPDFTAPPVWTPCPYRSHHAIVLIPLRIRVPKAIPLLELFSSNRGTFRFLRRKWKIPSEERNKTSEESDDTSEETIHAHVENKK